MKNCFFFRQSCAKPKQAGAVGAYGLTGLIPIARARRPFYFMAIGGALAHAGAPFLADTGAPVAGRSSRREHLRLQPFCLFDYADGRKSVEVDGMPWQVTGTKTKTCGK
jgi:hypothetical protein